jgi:heme-degrading monooxygenase HmoA
MARYRHIAVFIAKPGITAQQIIGPLESLRGLPGIVELTVRESLDTRKGIVIMFNSLFTDEAAFQAYRAAPQHKQVANRMREIADWWVADYAED